ncbi:bifunctional demethylmenaquinone methyltransferase/2-methoxy-6-polyprenyl-1,4-benzoquinol methylase UbiE [Novispirillum sp. DQ9]|uniref:bifunctional demethylmenaquinone methyltransferase/2-methoxy-6-polyprenyl-1,4-benzoquinol methylase UbiE n=1 Tax=Novispirillum sp. DQ9 TaxID=3398612 RepID=UPI003C7986B0
MTDRDTNTTEAAAGDTTHFGFRTVRTAEKKGMVREVFDSVAERYDLMNDLMSAGVHRVWKARFIDWLAPRPGMALLDVAGGTGDIAFRFLEAAARKGADPATQVTVCDINEEMLKVGRNRAVDKGILGGVEWVRGDAEALPFEDCSFDAYTIAFGLRNVTDIDAALREARRVLKPGGRFMCLEFSHVVVPGLDALYDVYSFQVLPRLGQVVARNRDAYQYLVESIRKFPPQQALLARMDAAGLRQGKVRNLSGGIAAIHSAWRI